MRSWLLLLGGLIIWAVHFFLLYGIGEFAGAGRVPRAAILAATIIALASLALLLAKLGASPSVTGFEGWRRSLALSGASLGGLAVIWQTLVLIA